MSIGTHPTDFRVYKTLDGGATWTIQFENQIPAGFYDGFAFWTPHRGILHGDSINRVFPDFRTRRDDMAEHQRQHAAGFAR